MVRDYNMKSEQRYLFLHNLLSGDAKRYGSNNVQGDAADFEEAIALIDAE